MSLLPSMALPVWRGLEVSGNCVPLVPDGNAQWGGKRRKTENADAQSWGG